MSVWLLTAGTYSDYHVVGAFESEEHARRIANAVKGADTGYDEYQVEEVAFLPPGLRAEHAYTSLSLTFIVHWTGRVRFDALDAEQPGYSRQPIATTHLTGLPDGNEKPRSRERPAACTVEVRAMEQDYTLGVHLHVHGTDIERVHKVFTERRAQLTAEPAIHTVRAWAERGKVPPWVWTRTENQGVLDALRRAGVQ